MRGSLTVQCRYEPGWETYSKWWCQGAQWKDCHILVQTDGSEREEKGHHVSIKDNQKSRTFTVTMEELRWNNADTYWCGIERSGTDLGVQVKVTIDPAQCLSLLSIEIKVMVPVSSVDQRTFFAGTQRPQFLPMLSWTSGAHVSLLVLAFGAVTS
ncbi:hypothetical protein GH733_018905 [Mirounga leonina]|nr:hypothetical protein GH733_018905 [Mirounga leonina]